MAFLFQINYQNGRTTESCFLSAIGYRRLWSFLLVYQNGIHCFIVRLRALLIAVFKWVHELNPCLFWPESPTIHAVSQCSFNQVKPIKHGTWWRHQMETFSALLAICAGIHRSPVNSPHKGQWRGALMFSLICARINNWVNNGEAGDLRRHRGHYDVIVMSIRLFKNF